LVARSGRKVSIEDGATPIHNSAGELVGAVAAFTEVTERRRFEQERERMLRELERSNAELARFSHTVSHDLQAPVRTIKGFVELLSRRLQGRLEENDIDLLTTIVETAGSMERLIQSLLGYAQAGQRQVNRDTVSVGTVLQYVLTTLEPLLAETNAQITYTQMPTIEADRVQLQQLFQNLLTNAVKYRRAEEPLVVRVSAERADGGWRFAVRDNGQGISRQHFDRIFEPLKRLHGGDVPGSGIGLALCRTIVDRHGGRIWVESDGPGQGATFFVFLPGPVGPASNR
jgi:light-regulated signal transduction histidine kinase (bacteriophytochrome)